ncbi:hypothetical protein A1359_15385 [Methylomonas lenta]|uniref:Uncharacterized protein n=1 Tax=Methylomonas lenta TaxID=980561 RepID=A0A177N020_9GAMM|nr:hypothetical protein [Methylomonas lenta]MDD2739715.1 hypothetical protein [Methylomonas lenta]OAI10994.1 hypothetical protein A1359_15385 [Methylomonas lenta]
MKTTRLFRSGLIGFMGLIFSSVLWAHGGAAGTDTDQCKFELEKDHWIHYTAYQPKAYPAEEFCGNLPDIDTKTQLVFDYQDQRYRGMSVEFEVTKEPEGTRVFYEEPKKHKSGTVILDLPNGVPEIGKYLIHITLMQDNGERLDAHMGFKAGEGQPTSSGSLALYALVLFAALYIFYLSNANFKRKVDEMISKAKEV